MKIPLPVAEKLALLQNGERIPLSRLKKYDIVEQMLDNDILKKQILGRSKALVFLPNPVRLTDFLSNHFGIDDLTGYLEFLKRETGTRAEAVVVASNSKVKPVRTFKGFLVNCYQPVECMLNGNPVSILPTEGTFTFIYDYEKFTPSEDITIVGIENPENFRYICKQRRLFEGLHPLFVSRYPQSKDLIKWLQKIPNQYLHFGDFDFAGLNIYQNEYKKYLSGKAALFLPPDIEYWLSLKGNRNNYNKQTVQFDKTKIEEPNVLQLLSLIEKYKKGLEQEIFAKEHLTGISRK